MFIFLFILIGVIVVLYIYILWLEMFVWEICGLKVFCSLLCDLFLKIKVLVVN